MEKYVIRDSGRRYALTGIHRIGTVKRRGDEWIRLFKRFVLEEAPDFAAFRLDSQGVSGVWINGEFAEGASGRYANRITCAECTSLLRAGENEIEIRLGGHFYQSVNEKHRDRSGVQFLSAALELRVETGGERQLVCTDGGWQCRSDDGQLAPQCFSQVTQGEYDRFWLSAALIPEPRPVRVPAPVAALAGEEYARLLSMPWEKEKIIDQVIASDRYSLTYDLGKLFVGYLQVDCEAAEEGSLTAWFDYTEQAEEFDREKPPAPTRLLKITKPLKRGVNRLFFLRRRAFRFLRLQFDVDVRVKSVSLRLRMTPPVRLGWFHCEDGELNKMWQVGKYTLHVNKHQEYESCPRNEMKYFSGDGIVDALVDHYAFGDCALTYSSLSLTEQTLAGGLCPDRFARNTALTDYPAWRIVSAYHQYFYYGDRYFLEQHYGELVQCLDWLIEKMNDGGLIFQYPVPFGAFHTEADAVEYTCSFDRLGEKPLINALLYKSLLCMAELGRLQGDERAEFWESLAQRVKTAFNERLWEERRGAYLDTLDPSYLPHDGNALALLYGLAEGERAERVKKTLREKLWTPWGAVLTSEPLSHTRGGNTTVSPMMNLHEAEARFRSGDSEGALELMRRCWGTMLKKGAETFWEFAPADGESRWSIPSHAWSSGCTYLLSAFVLGIRPASAGYGEVLFCPQGGLQAVEGVVPTCRGYVAARIRGKRCELAVPKGMKVKAVLPPELSLEVREY